MATALFSGYHNSYMPRPVFPLHSSMSTPTAVSRTPEIKAAASVAQEVVAQAQPELTRCVVDFLSLVKAAALQPEASSTVLDLDLWRSIAECAEMSGYRMEYLADKKTIMVTWPSQTHDAFTKAVRSFHAIEDKYPNFACQYNANIRLPNMSSRIPDFAFGARMPTEQI
ncbi:hypothetical protein B0H16DRAFT_1729848 [Mycena metata]|uniref:Uncharacterized protein n=1 Tax=Mycena metata TaxID=1033252 RepID=A0AAD7IAB2_9AGAR|nr:hypothetical protein B0H16DRAFT_1729848 [Mycena metata]